MISVVLIRFLLWCTFRVLVTVVGHAAVFCPKYPFDLFETFEVRVICHFLSGAPRDVSFLMFFVRRCEVGSLFSHLYMLKPSVHLSMVDVL